MAESAELLKAIGALLWPLFAFVTLLIFKTEIRSLLKTFKRGKILGQEFEVEKTLNTLNVSANAAAQEVAALPPSPDAQSLDSADDVATEVLTLAGTSPTAALVLLAGKIEREARHLLASSGHFTDRHLSLGRAIDEVNKKTSGLPEHVTGAIEDFSRARNRLVHGGHAEPSEILRAIDSGLTIYKALRAIPRETAVVYHVGVDLFGDEACTVLIPDGKGVILDLLSNQGLAHNYRIHPTTRKHFVKGMVVASEWNMGKIFPDAWYISPDTGQRMLAWNSSAEFVGRSLDDI